MVYESILEYDAVGNLIAQIDPPGAKHMPGAGGKWAKHAKDAARRPRFSRHLSCREHGSYWDALIRVVGQFAIVLSAVSAGHPRLPFGDIFLQRLVDDLGPGYCENLPGACAEIDAANQLMKAGKRMEISDSLHPYGPEDGSL